MGYRTILDRKHKLWKDIEDLKRISNQNYITKDNLAKVLKLIKRKKFEYNLLGKTKK